MSLYRVDKTDVGVTLHLSDGSTLRGSLFVAPCSARGAGPQTVAELLAETGAALPFATSDGKFLLVGTASIAAVAVNAPEHPLEGFRARFPGSLRLVGGHVFRGSLLLEQGAADRLSDAVRAAEPWLTLEAVHGLVWVSKAHLVTLEAEGT